MNSFRDIDVEKKEAMELFGVYQSKNDLHKLELSTRSFNCLTKNGITSIESILDLSDNEIMRLKYMNKKSYEEIKTKLLIFIKSHPNYTL